MCNNCIHKAVCSKFAATGGHVRECEHFKEERKGRWVRYMENCLHNKCSRCFIGHCREDNYCPNCGCRMGGD